MSGINIYTYFDPISKHDVFVLAVICFLFPNVCFFLKNPVQRFLLPVKLHMVLALFLHFFAERQPWTEDGTDQTA